MLGAKRRFIEAAGQGVGAPWELAIGLAQALDGITVVDRGRREGRRGAAQRPSDWRQPRRPILATRRVHEERGVRRASTLRAGLWVRLNGLARPRGLRRRVTPRHRGLVTTGRCSAVLLLPARLSPPRGRWGPGRSRPCPKRGRSAYPGLGTLPHSARAYRSFSGEGVSGGAHGLVTRPWEERCGAPSPYRAPGDGYTGKTWHVPKRAPPHVAGRAPARCARLRSGRRQPFLPAPSWGFSIRRA